MNRSVRSLLSVSVLAPAAALAFAAAPANAAPGPSTTLLYETYAAAAPVTRTLPEPVTQTAGQTAELATLTVDGVLQSAPAASDVRAARCSLNPGKTVNSGAGTSLPDTPLSIARTPLGALPEGDCLASPARADRHSAANALPVPSGGAGETSGGSLGDLPRTLLGRLGSVVGGGSLGGLPGAANATPGAGAGLPGARHAEAPLSMSLTDVPSTLGAAAPAGLPVGTTLFPPAERSARPGPAEDLLGQGNDVVNEAGAGLHGTENGVGQVVEVLKAGDRVGHPADDPVSLLDPAGIGLPTVPGLG